LTAQPWQQVVKVLAVQLKEPVVVQVGKLILNQSKTKNRKLQDGELPLLPNSLRLAQVASPM